MNKKANGQHPPIDPAGGDLRPSEEISGTKPAPGFSEDIWAVIIGSLLIAVVLIAALVSPGFKFSTPVYQWATQDDLVQKVLSGNNLLLLGGIGLVLAAISAFAIRFSGGSLRQYAGGFLLVYLLAVVSLIIAGNKAINAYGVEYVVFALIIGLLIGNLVKLPPWLQQAARSEFFIKTGLIILGITVLITDIMQAGLPGILQSVIVVSVVWFFALWLSRRMKVDDEFGVILASAVSICGVSAAIVASGAIQGDKKKLSYVTTLVLLVAIPMLILQPWLVRQMGLSEIVGGAWLGGTLDTTASVTAASQIVGPVAVKTGVIIKFSQNVLIGIAAFFIAAWWTLRKQPDQMDVATESKGWSVIWDRFPKFVLGFIAVSLVFSFLIPAATTKQVSPILNSIRTIWFALAFVAIGLEARFADLVKFQGGRPALVFIGAQVFNILWTLLWAYLLFGGVLLPVPDIK
jgi:uncharacterized integral membrane protein (TIGR00698 family)